MEQTIDQKIAEIDSEVDAYVESVGGLDRIEEDRELWAGFCDFRSRSHDIIESVFPAIPKEIGELTELVGRLQAIIEDLHYVYLNRDSVEGTWNVMCSCDQEFPKRTTGTEAIEDGLVHLAESPRPSWER